MGMTYQSPVKQLEMMEPDLGMLNAPGQIATQFSGSLSVQNQLKQLKQQRRQRQKMLKRRSAATKRVIVGQANLKSSPDRAFFGVAQ